METWRSAAIFAITLCVVAVLTGCPSSTSSGEDPPEHQRKFVSEFVLIRDIPGSIFTTESGSLEIDVIWRDKNSGAILGDIDRPVFIIDENAEPHVVTDDNGFSSTTDRRFRNGAINVAPGTYRIYSPSNVDVTVYERSN